MTDAGSPKPADRQQRLNPALKGPLILGAIALVLILGLVLFGREGPVQRQSEQVPVDVAEEESGTAERSCSSQAAYDLMKRELFSRAATIRGSDQQAFDQLSAYSALRVSSPIVTHRDPSLGLVACRATVSLDLPPGVAVVGGRRTLTSVIDYALQDAADGSGGVMTIDTADAITVPLATLARTTPPAEQQQQDPSGPGFVLPEAPVQPDAPAPTASSGPAAGPGSDAQSSVIDPSFNCRYAKTRGEIAVCNDSTLAALDRQMAAAYSRAYGQGGPRQRELLQQTRNRFLAYRDRCRSDSCIADAYRGRIREIADIVAGRWRLDQ